MSYLTEVLADSPALLLRLGEPSGTTAEDSTTNNRDGAINGTPTLGLAGPCDDGATAMAFDGTDDYVTVTDGADVDGTGDFTLECWVKPGTQIDTNTKLFYKRTGGNGYGVHITTSTGLVTFEVEVGAANTQIIGTTDIRSASAFYHVVAVRSGATMSLYVNGVLEAGPTACSSSSVANTLALWLGSNDAVTRRLIGTGANFAFYNTALAGARILAHYAARVTTTTTTPTYDALLASVAPAFVVLVEPQPMEPLHSWTAAGGGLTNTWYASYLTQIAADLVAGGLYRRLDDVRQNDTPLTSRASAALVDANLGSYFHDTATSRIYVSTTTGSSPEVFALIGVWFRLFFSTTSVTFSDQPLYAPLVTGQLPSVSAEKPDPLFGVTVSDTGTVSFLNGDGLFDRLSRRYVWRNKAVWIRLGGAGLAFSDFALAGVIWINHLAVDDELATLQFATIGSILNRTLPTRTWGDGTFVGQITEEGALGLRQPILFGRVTDCPLVLGDRPANKYYTVDALVHAQGILVDAVSAIHRVTKVRTSLTVLEAIVGSGGYTVFVDAAYPPEDYEIRADLRDAPAGVDLTPTFGQCARYLLRRCGEADGNLDVGAFTAADIAAPQLLGIYLTEPTIAADVMRQLEQSVLGQVYVAMDGRWTCRVFDPSLPAFASLADADFAVWAADIEFQAVLNEVRVQYAFNPATGDTTEASSSDDVVRFASQTSDSHTVETCLRDAEDASALAGHYRFLKSAPSTRIQFEERGLTLMGAQVGDLVQVTRDRAPVARTGRYDGHVLQLVVLDKALGPDTPIVRGVLDDLEGQTDRIARCLGAAEDVNWSAATAIQRAVYGFCADANRYLDPADPLTKDLKVVW